MYPTGFFLFLFFFVINIFFCVIFLKFFELAISASGYYLSDIFQLAHQQQLTPPQQLYQEHPLTSSCVTSSVATTAAVVTIMNELSHDSGGAVNYADTRNRMAHLLNSQTEIKRYQNVSYPIFNKYVSRKF